MLKKWIRQSNMTYKEVANKLDIPESTLYDIITRRSPNTTVVHCLKIKKLTGLEPHQYLDGVKVVDRILRSRGQRGRLQNSTK